MDTYTVKYTFAGDNGATITVKGLLVDVILDFFIPAVMEGRLGKLSSWSVVCETTGNVVIKDFLLNN